MKKIPVRYINATLKEPVFFESFSIRDIRDLLAGKDMIQELHRHDFFLILVLKKGMGNHEIDFTSYKISDHSIFFLRPGQVHQLTLKQEVRGSWCNLKLISIILMTRHQIKYYAEPVIRTFVNSMPPGSKNYFPY